MRSQYRAWPMTALSDRISSAVAPPAVPRTEYPSGHDRCLARRAHRLCDACLGLAPGLPQQHLDIHGRCLLIDSRWRPRQHLVVDELQAHVAVRDHCAQRGWTA